MGGWLYKHENITNSASNSVEVGAGAELGTNKSPDTGPTIEQCKHSLDKLSTGNGDSSILSKIVKQAVELLLQE